jgi:medium-chain acyl-[acyl-carrier-protein] hydrolase
MSISVVSSISDVGEWILASKPNPTAHLRLFCLPYAGAGPYIFRTWPASLPREVELCPIQLPGHGKRVLEPAFTDLSRIVELLADAVLPWLDRRFALFGHSMGALIAFELARLLKRKHELAPERLFVSGCFAPQMPNGHRFHKLPNEELIRELLRFNGLPHAVAANMELINLMLPILRADLTATETYECKSGPALTCPISVFGGFSDPLASRKQLEGWHDHTNAEFSLEMFQGDHFFIHTGEQLLLCSLSSQLRATVDS